MNINACLCALLFMTLGSANSLKNVLEDAICSEVIVSSCKQKVEICSSALLGYKATEVEREPFFDECAKELKLPVSVECLKDLKIPCPVGSRPSSLAELIGDGGLEAHLPSGNRRPVSSPPRRPGQNEKTKIQKYMDELTLNNPALSKSLKYCILFKDMLDSNGQVSENRIKNRFVSFALHRQKAVKDAIIQATEKCVEPPNYTELSDYLKCVGKGCVQNS